MPHDAYSIGTPVATIGIRGTSLEIIVADSGLSTVALSRGAVVVSNLKGVSVDLKPGEATTILPPDADGNQEPPSPPGPLPPDLQAILWAMTVAIRNADPPSDVNPGAGTGNNGNGLTFTPTTDNGTGGVPPGSFLPTFPASITPGLNTNPGNTGAGTTGTGTTGTGTTGTGTTGTGTTGTCTTGTGTTGTGTAGTCTTGTGTTGTGTTGTGTTGTGTTGTGTTGTGTTGTGTTGTGTTGTGTTGTGTTGTGTTGTTGTGTTGTGTTGTGTTGTGTTGTGTTGTGTTGTGTTGAGTTGTGTTGTGTTGTGTTGTGTTGTGTTGTGTSGTGTTGPDQGTGTTGPPHRSNPPTHVNLGQVTFAPTRGGNVTQVTFLLTFPTGQTIDLADALILNDPTGVFSIAYPSGETPTLATDANGNPIEVLAVLASFAPPWGATGEFDATFEIPDQPDATQEFDLYLAGDALAIAEPASVIAFGFGLACLLVGRRRRVAGR